MNGIFCAKVVLKRALMEHMQLNFARICLRKPAYLWYTQRSQMDAMLGIIYFLTSSNSCNHHYMRCVLVLH